LKLIYNILGSGKMKIVAINSSPKGKDSNTNVLVSAFLKGAQTAGAETVNIFLADYEIKHCNGCLVCWSRGPGQCVISDDMLKIFLLLGDADIIVFATPVYFENISGMLKVFMDRMVMIGSPHSQKASKEANRDIEQTKAKTPKLMIISNCGYPDRNQFQVVSLWIKRVAIKMQMDLIGEIYTPQGKLLTSPTEEQKPTIFNYLNLVKMAGKEIATNVKLSATTKKLLEQILFPK
jgi:multimeric flavodoxin WrbA